MKTEKEAAARATNSDDRQEDEAGANIPTRNYTPTGSYPQRVLKEALALAEDRRFAVAAFHSIDRIAGKCTCGIPTCEKPGKHPATAHGIKDATMDGGEIRGMFGDKARNIIVQTGMVSGIVVMDIDPRHGGDASLRRLISENADLPQTLTARTGGGGEHYYFRYPDGVKSIKSAPLAGYDGIDIRGDKGSAIAPPSRHISGNSYEWVDPSAEIAPLPEWLKPIISSNAEKAASTTNGDGKIKVGNRHEALLKRAGQLRILGHDEEFIFDALVSFSAEHCEEPTDEKELREIAKFVAGKPIPGNYRSPTNKVLKELAALASTSFIEPVDPKLTRLIEEEADNILKGAPPDWDASEISKQIAAMKRDVLVGYIKKIGDLIHAEGDRFFFLNKRQSHLYDLEHPLWAAWLYCLCSGIIDQNRQKELTKELVIVTRMQRPIPVYRFAYWDTGAQVLFVSQFNGRVFRLDGESISSVRNGEGVLFEENADWIPYEPKEPRGKGPDPYRSLLYDFPKWDGHADEKSLALHCWVISLFFPELCPTKPLLLLQGEKGSGKSTLLRVILKYLFGRYAEVVGVPDKPDAFNVLASQSHIVALDNMDEPCDWLQDKLARLSTGFKEVVRKLFTTNDSQTILFRSYAAITARTPETLKRDDIADRSVILTLRRINEDATSNGAFQIERDMFKRIEGERGLFWGILLAKLNRVVEAIRAGQMPQRSSFRLADWETLGRLVARIEGEEKSWNAALELIVQSQKTLLIEDEPLTEALKAALAQERVKKGEDSTYTSSDLYKVLIKMHDEYGIKPDPCFRNLRVFSKRLSMLYSVLSTELGIRKERGTARAEHHRNIYYFDPSVELDIDDGRMFRKSLSDLGDRRG